MNPHYTDFRFPSIKKMSWSKVLGGVGGEEGARSAKDAQDLEDAKDLVSARGWVGSWMGCGMRWLAWRQGPRQAGGKAFDGTYGSLVVAGRWEVRLVGLGRQDAGVEGGFGGGGSGGLSDAASGPGASSGAL